MSKTRLSYVFKSRYWALTLLMGMFGSEAYAQVASARTHAPSRSVRTAIRSNSTDNEWMANVGLGVGLEALVSGRSDVKAPNTDERALFEYNVRSPLRYELGFESRGTIGAPFSSIQPSSRGRELMIEIPELNVSWVDAPGSDTTTFAIFGRKLENWSDVDSSWNLGVWQPLNRFDALRPIEQGLTGAFLGHAAHGFRAFLFASPVYLPEQGPAFVLEDGRFYAQNPWFAPSTDRLIVLNRENEIRYTLDAPSVGSVVGHGAFGTLIRLGSDGVTPGVGLKLGYAHKPRNQLSLPYDGYVDLKSAHVNILPRVVYHDVYSFDLGYRGRDWRLSFASLTEMPKEETQVPQGLTGQVLGPVTFVSPSIEMRLFSSHFWGPKFKFSWLESFEEGTKMVGPLASGGDSPFGPRSMYRKAFSAEVTSTLYRSWQWSLNQSIRWIEEFAEDSRAVMFDLSMASRNSWRLGIYADLLQSRQPEDSNPGFISRFRGNDRVGTRFMLAF